MKQKLILSILVMTISMFVITSVLAMPNPNNQTPNPNPINMTPIPYCAPITVTTCQLNSILSNITYLNAKVITLQNQINNISLTPGPQGLKGDKGDQGLQGLQGLTGKDGTNGLNGQDGATGPQGSSGEKGDKGDTGETGLTGSQGLQGLKGDTGLQGIQGIPGLNGQDGATGLQGLKGDKGDTGLTGSQGLQGLKGDKGDIGLTGSQGLQGLKGNKGDTGLTGSQGLKGDTGLTGATGPQGPKGTDGTNATVDLNPILNRLTALELFQSKVFTYFTDFAIWFNTPNPCVNGQYQCSGNSQQKCISYTWVNQQTCTYGCNLGNCNPQPNEDCSLKTPTHVCVNGGTHSTNLIWSCTSGQGTLHNCNPGQCTSTQDIYNWVPCGTKGCNTTTGLCNP